MSRVGTWLVRLCNKGKCRLGEDIWGIRPQGKDHPQKRSTINRDRITLKELYHNPDPLYRLIGEPNETSIIVENQKIKGLIHSGAQISSILDKFAKLLNLEVKKLETLLDLEPTGGGQVPYDGYVEVRLQIPDVQAFDLDVLMLVIPKSEYSKVSQSPLVLFILTK